MNGLHVLTNDLFIVNKTFINTCTYLSILDRSSKQLKRTTFFHVVKKSFQMVLLTGSLIHQNLEKNNRAKSNNRLTTIEIYNSK